MSATTSPSSESPGSRSLEPIDALERLSTQFGGRWTGVRFDYDRVAPGQPPSSAIRLCAAIARSFSTTIVLPASLVSCPGAIRCLGLGGSNEDLVKKIHQSTKLSSVSIARAVEATPRLMRPVASVTLGKGFPFDIAVTCANPMVIMSVLRKWQAACGGDPLSTSVSTFMAVCGNVVVASHESGSICLSFGCPTSRGEGVLPAEEMSLAIPQPLVDMLTRPEGSA